MHTYMEQPQQDEENQKEISLSVVPVWHLLFVLFSDTNKNATGQRYIKN